MNHLNYWKLPGFENIFLEDSYVFKIGSTSNLMDLIVEAVLTEAHPQYHPPLPKEQYCYREMILSFPFPQKYLLILSNIKAAKSADNSLDYGGIDKFYRNGDVYCLNGDWEELIIVCDRPTLTPGTMAMPGGQRRVLSYEHLKKSYFSEINSPAIILGIDYSNLFPYSTYATLAAQKHNMGSIQAFSMG
ncbi:MAG: hypothetical protein HC890_17860 [Chloroflexaceae bacterium]|nr:hypothetical protein [Chloroflexaceae bacterium]